MNDRAFKAAVKKIRSSANREDLFAATQKGLTALLPGPGNQGTLASLTSQAQNIISPLAANTGEQTPEVRQAAVRCVVLMETARNKQTPGNSPRNRRLLILGVATAAVATFYLLLIIQR